MAKKRRKTGRRAQSQRRTYLLIGGVVAVALIAVAAIVLLDQGAGRSEAGTAAEKRYGPADAAVEVVEYADFQCPACRVFAQGAGRQLREAYADTGQVRILFRNFAFIGNESTWAAEAAECANEQGKFWEYHDKLFEEQGGENVGAYSRANLKRFAAELGLDSAQFDECVDTERYARVVRDEANEARRRRINATPTLLVNGQVVPNGTNYQVLQAAVEAALR